MKRSSLALLLAPALVAGCGLRQPKGMPGGPDPDMTAPVYDLAAPPPVDLRGVYNADAACAQANATAQPARRAIDLIVVIDNSPSMADEIHAVEININENLTRILDQSGLDYRVIFVTSFGEWTQNKICVGPPLSPTDCAARPLNGPPKNGPRYFHYDYPILTNDSLSKLLDTYRKSDRWNLAPNGWGGYLRPGTQKVFVEISDDRSDMNELDFDFRLRALDKAPFFTDDNKSAYVFHSIVGLKANDPPTKPWGPSDPFQDRTCSNEVWSPGDEFQNLSIATGGMRYPICQRANFDNIFREFAKVLSDGAKLDCEIAVPAPPDKKEIDYTTLLVEFLPSGPFAVPVQFDQVRDKAQCAPRKFYLSQGQASIVLCPETCDEVQADLMSSMKLLYNCVEIM